MHTPRGSIPPMLDPDSEPDPDDMLSWRSGYNRPATGDEAVPEVMPPETAVRWWQPALNAGLKAAELSAGHRSFLKLGRSRRNKE